MRDRQASSRCPTEKRQVTGRQAAGKRQGASGRQAAGKRQASGRQAAGKESAVEERQRNGESSALAKHSTLPHVTSLIIRHPDPLRKPIVLQCTWISPWLYYPSRLTCSAGSSRCATSTSAERLRMQASQAAPSHFQTLSGHRCQRRGLQRHRKRQGEVCNHKTVYVLRDSVSSTDLRLESAMQARTLEAAAVELRGHQRRVGVALVERHGVPIRGRARLDDGALEEATALGHHQVSGDRAPTCRDRRGQLTWR